MIHKSVGYYEIHVCLHTACFNIEQAVLLSVYVECHVTADAFQIILGRPPNGDSDPLGWVEKNGDEDKTTPDEYVHVGDLVEIGVQINVGWCRQWYV